MVKRGRKPKPAAIKKLQGNPGKRPLNDNSPSTPGKMPEPPSWLDDEARAEWLRVGPPLAARGLLTELDVGVFIVYCTTWSMYREALRNVQEHGAVLMSKKGSLYTSPYTNILSGAMKRMVAIACEFGMTPSSRERVRAIDPTQEVDPITEMLNQRESLN
ncbi:unnamed protein product [marine sediment metagenome]|uniref:Phage terminase small subunit P27 family n=1 Tax=marine sediment metagenome TaxID=412755 RepID=X0XHU3_9ZZZZ